MRIITINHVKELLTAVGFNTFMEGLCTTMKEDFKNWHALQKMPRPAIYYDNGVIELMPISDAQFYGYKYVNCHPNNTQIGLPTVMGIGQLANTNTGEPILLSEMTILTALRTAAASCIAAEYLAKKDSHILCIIGTGAQSEFQALALMNAFPIQTIQYYDIDPKAMEKFHANMKSHSIHLVPCHSAAVAVRNSDIICTLTACKERKEVITKEMLEKGMFINAVGGDAPGKTELDTRILENSKVVVEYIPQTLKEGEIQWIGEKVVHAELWELIANHAKGRENEDEITVFDSVGFAIEDLSTLKYVYHLAKKHNIGITELMIPKDKNPKDLISWVKN